ncbi:MAG TPA: nitronate monooxygenase [Pseudonocardiaceae bacterium]|jgi:nitronate monooxygenase|nr:nitronate monooxygenase [Pseudonocardiaceae bacterium]
MVSAHVLPIRIPIIAAPMAGGPSTPELAAAVSSAGGLGFLAGGYLSPTAFDERLTAIEALTDAPYGVNLFLPSPRTSDLGPINAYRQQLQPRAAALGVEPGRASWDDDALEAKADVLARHRPAAVSFTFDRPDVSLCDRIRQDTDALLIATVTSAEEARLAETSGVDLLAVQGAEAGGHRGIFRDDPALVAGGPATPLLELLDAVSAASRLPLIAAGGLASGKDIAQALDRGAVAAALGTSFLCCPEAGTSAAYRRALLTAPFAETVFTRAFTGRPARALVNAFVREHQEHAPAGYPEIHHVTRPIRAAAAAAGDLDNLHLWAGASWQSVTEEPAAELLTRLATELTAARGK